MALGLDWGWQSNWGKFEQSAAIKPAHRLSLNERHWSKASDLLAAPTLQNNTHIVATAGGLD